MYSVDFGQVVKQYSRKQKDDHRYEPPRDTDFIRKNHALFLPKPYTHITLAKAVRDCLDMATI